MEITAILAIVDGALTILEKTLPAITDAAGQGAISTEQQQVVYQRLGRLRAGGGAFTGPAWTSGTAPATAG